VLPVGTSPGGRISIPAPINQDFFVIVNDGIWHTTMDLFPATFGYPTECYPSQFLCASGDCYRLTPIVAGLVGGVSALLFALLGLGGYNYWLKKKRQINYQPVN